MHEKKIRWGGSKMGSVVGIHIEVAGMYTGTVIRDLMVTVERAETRFELRQIVEFCELERLYQLPAPAEQTELAGAA